MKQTVTQQDFTEAFRRIRPDNFSYAGLLALFDYLEEIEEDTGEGWELDVIAICCDWCESTVDEFIEYYEVDWDEFDFKEDAIIDHLDNHGGLYCWAEQPSGELTVVFNAF